MTRSVVIRVDPQSGKFCLNTYIKEFKIIKITLYAFYFDNISLPEK